MSSFRTKHNVTVTIDKAGNHFIGAKCVNPLRDSSESIRNSLDRFVASSGYLIPLPQVTGFVPHKIVNGEFVRA